MRVTKPRNRTLIHETKKKIDRETHHFTNPILREEIEKKAYELYQGRGCVHGHDLEDWLEAERLVMEKKGASHDA